MSTAMKKCLLKSDNRYVFAGTCPQGNPLYLIPNRLVLTCDVRIFAEGFLGFIEITNECSHYCQYKQELLNRCENCKLRFECFTEK
jgi:hypothetical protein